MMTPKSPPTPTTWASRALVSGLKLGAAGATIFAIGWAFLTLAPSGEVADSQADIADFALFAPETHTQRFANSLKELGHEPPRVYNYNGNDVYFSTRSTPKRPRELILEYQEEFVRQGVNSQVWDVREDLGELARQGRLEQEADARMSAMLDGELQVLYHDPNRMIMASALLDAGRLGPEDVQPRVGPDGEPVLGVKFDKVFQSHNYIEANWNPIEQETTVTASWSDEDFDIAKALPRDPHDPAQDVAPDPDVPACIGCTRLTRFAAQSEQEKPFVKQIFVSTQSPRQLERFYELAMRNRGWDAPKNAETLKELMGTRRDDFDFSKVLHFHRDGEFLTISIQPGEAYGETFVTTMITD